VRIIPDVKVGESEKDYISRCIPIVLKDGTANDNKQATAVCYAMWHKSKGYSAKGNEDMAIPTQNEPKDTFIQRCKLEKAVGWDARPIYMPQQPGGDDTTPDGGRGQQSAPKKELYTFDADCDQAIEFVSDVKEQFSNTEGNKYTAVAVIGDRFYHGKFLAFSEISKAAESMNGAYHDINHWGTTYTDGNPNIEYIIGYQKNTTVDPISKKMKTDIFVNEKAPHYNTWKNFIDVSKDAGRTPNVSVSFWGSNKKVKANELPTGTSFQQQGYEENDEVPYLYDLQFQALSTVFQGACDDKAGCGIGIGLNLKEIEKEVDKLTEDLAVWTSQYINDLPDSSFAYIEPGGTKDSSGKTTPRSLRHFPYKDASGKVDLPHLRNALARAPQSPFGDKAMPKLKAAAKAAGVGNYQDEDEVRKKLELEIEIEKQRRKK